MTARGRLGFSISQKVFLHYRKEQYCKFLCVWLYLQAVKATMAAKALIGTLAMIAASLLRLRAATTPPNDDFANRITLTGPNFTASGSNTNATKQPQEPNHAGVADGKSVWWSWMAPDDGEVEITTDGSDFDTVLAIYVGSSVSALTVVASNDDRSQRLVSSRVRFVTFRGTNYQIAVDGSRDNTPSVGSIRLNLAFTSGPIVRPPNDNFSNGIVVTGITQVATGSNVRATREAGEPLHAGEPGDTSVWWRWMVPASGETLISTEGSSFDTLLGVYTGNSLSGLSLMASNDDVNAAIGIRTSEVIFNASAGQILQIAVDGYDAAWGDIRLSMGPVVRPPNDNFTNRIVVTGTSLVVTGSNVRATREVGESLHAGQIGERSVWWGWTVPDSGPFAVSTQGSTFDTLLGVYTGISVTNLSPVASNNDANPPAVRTSLVILNATAGQTLQIAVDGFEGASGNIVLQIRPLKPLLGVPRILADGAFQFTITGPAGQTNAIQASTNLTFWTTLETLVNSNGAVIFKDSAATGFVRRFYRAEVK